MLKNIVTFFLLILFFAKVSATEWQNLVICIPDKPTSILDSDNVSSLVQDMLPELATPIITTTSVITDIKSVNKFIENLNTENPTQQLSERDKRVFNLIQRSSKLTTQQIIEQIKTELETPDKKFSKADIIKLRKEGKVVNFLRLSKSYRGSQQIHNYNCFDLKDGWILLIPKDYNHFLNLQSFDQTNIEDVPEDSSCRKELFTEKIKSLIPMKDSSEKRWNIVIWGHGSAKEEIIVNLKLTKFLDLLNFFNNHVLTHSLLFLSCHAGGKQSGDICKEIPNLNYHLINASGNGGNVSLCKLMPTIAIKEYFESLKSFTPDWYTVLKTLNWESSFDHSQMPKVRLPGDSKFRIIDLGTSVFNITRVTANLLRDQGSPKLDLTQQKSIVIDAPRIDSSVTLNGNKALIRSGIPGPATHYIKELDIKGLRSFQDILPKVKCIFNNPALDSEKLFLVEKLRFEDKLGSSTEAKNLMFFLNSNILRKANQNGFVIETNKKILSSMWPYTEESKSEPCMDTENTPRGKMITAILNEKFSKFKPIAKSPLSQLLEERSSTSPNESNLAEELEQRRADSPSWRNFQARSATLRTTLDTSFRPVTPRSPSTESKSPLS